jgi:hypothetical protein
MACMNPTERFWVKVHKTEGCWLWTGCASRYGFISWEGRRNRLAHRVSWELHFGPVPGGLCVLHRCDTPLCVRPDHLFLGTVKDNAEDRNGKQRQARGGRHGRRTRPECTARGERSGLAKLSEESVRGMRERHAAGGITFRQLGSLFGITGTHAHRIVTRQVWAHVE